MNEPPPSLEVSRPPLDWSGLPALEYWLAFSVDGEHLVPIRAAEIRRAAKRP
jgi:hypothetical protein